MTEFQSVSSMKVRREGSEGVLLKNCSFQHVFIWRFEQSSEEKRQTGELAWSFFLAQLPLLCLRPFCCGGFFVMVLVAFGSMYRMCREVLTL